MDNKFTCPICDKAGIPDFRNENVVCPCCGSDLSVYRAISTAQKGVNTTGERKTMPRWLATIASVVALCSIAACFYLYNHPPKGENVNQQLFAQIDTLKRENKLLSDSIVVLNKRPLPKERRTYTVVKGDCPWKISEEVFGDGSRYEELLRFNNMTTAKDFNKVKVGDTIYIEE